ncbi:hypothetical protein K402DRAFT_67932 [Aulographum hederae CBS 113979]|uniref:Uncharacterized protein n=1 Tax=Aulographum hederae CBS 113979 TaxID=1176131 RepID=A0A6G1H1B8_9PEZI|nr:hypothetical protein K402DRAFT_67932 [Aulographum hederae CBS 113979]
MPVQAQFFSHFPTRDDGPATPKAGRREHLNSRSGLSSFPATTHWRQQNLHRRQSLELSTCRPCRRRAPLSCDRSRRRQNQVSCSPARSIASILQKSSDNGAESSSDSTQDERRSERRQWQWLYSLLHASSRTKRTACTRRGELHRCARDRRNNDTGRSCRAHNSKRIRPLPR